MIDDSIQKGQLTQGKANDSSRTEWILKDLEHLSSIACWYFWQHYFEVRVNVIFPLWATTEDVSFYRENLLLWCF